MTSFPCQNLATEEDLVILCSLFNCLQSDHHIEVLRPGHSRFQVVKRILPPSSLILYPFNPAAIRHYNSLSLDL